MSIEGRKSVRHKTPTVNVGGVLVGGGCPIVVQSMTNTDTADVSATTQQILDLAKAGSELVRVTVDRDAAAAAVPKICERLAKKNCEIPIIGDFHYIGHKLLLKHPACAESLSKYRINPGNVGFGSKRDTQFALMIETALKYNKPIRIGVNWGSLDQDLLAAFMDENARAVEPKNVIEVTRQALVSSAISSAEKAESMGVPRDKIILSCKVSEVQNLVSVYRGLASKGKYAIHLGLTEAGMGSKGIVASTAAMSILLQEGIGDTIRVSLTPEPEGERIREVIVAQEILQTMGLRSFVPLVTACPGCGRTTSTVFQDLAERVQAFLREKMPVWGEKYIGVEEMQVAVMGCIVNGPGESKQADIGISLPGTGEEPAAPVFIDGTKRLTLRGDNLVEKFKDIVNEYVDSKYAKRPSLTSAQSTKKSS